MTVNEAKELYKNEYVEVEIYEPLSTGQHCPSRFHTDNCRAVDDYDEDAEAGLVELMGEDDYNHTLLANGDICADFDDWYGDKEAKVLCVMLK